MDDKREGQAGLSSGVGNPARFDPIVNTPCGSYHVRYVYRPPNKDVYDAIALE